MLNRNIPLVVCLNLIAAGAFAQANQGTGYVFEFANTTAASGQFQGFVYNAPSLGTPAISTTGPTGSTQIVAKPDGSKFYVPGANGLQTFDPAFTTPKTINGLTGSPTQAVITPDGRYLMVATSISSGSSSVYLLNTTNDTVVLNQPVSGTVIGMVVSRDAKTAWILGQSSQTFIIVINLTTLTQSGNAPIVLRDPVSGNSLGGNANAFTLSPLGLLYVSAGNEILEIDPAVLQTCLTSPLTCAPVNSVISVNATAGPLEFTPDSTLAYFINLTPSIGGKALLRMALPSHSIITWPPFVAGQQTELFDSIVVASPTRLFAHSPGDTTLWDVAPDFSTVGVSTLSTVLPATSVISMTLSGELPAPRYLFALVGGGSLASIYRADLTTNTVTSQASAALGSGTLQFSYIPQEANPVSFLTYNNPQTLTAGAKSAPLIARVLDAAGNPVYNVPVSFTGDPSLTFTNVSQTTNADGYVQATVTVGQAAGSFPVTLSAGAGVNVTTTSFSLTIPGSGNGGGGGGPNQMTIIAGNGQLFQASEPHFGTPPLTVLVTDDKGAPLQNQDVTFTVTGPPIATVDNPDSTTDQNGMTNTDFFPGFPPQNTPFQATTVTASSALGSVNFVETVFQPNPDGTGIPSATVQQPSGTQVIVAGEGDVVPEAIVVQVYSNAFGKSLPIPNVGIRIADAANAENNGPATCQGNPLSDENGAIHCALIAACSTTLGNDGHPLGLGLHGFSISIGEYNLKTNYAINIVPGAQQAIAISSGNSQTGKVGTALNLPLVATVSDQCGSPSQGITVTWKVTQGSATLAQTSTVSNQGGTVATHVTLGQAPGTVTITATINATTGVTFTETGTAVVGSLSLVSGGSQSALLNQQFTQPVVFQLRDTNGNGVPGLALTFGVASGSASVNVASAVTNASGQASVTVTAGSAAGPITISATYAGFTATASLTATSPGLPITPSSFINAGSFQAGLTPCGLASVQANGLVPSPGVFLGNPIGIGPLPYTLAGITITVNLIPVPLLSASNQNGVQQVNFQTPCETVPGSATVTVQINSSTTTIPNVTVYPAQPGIFTFAGPSGISYGWVIAADATSAPAGAGSTITPSNLARAGGTYYLVATGLGQTIPPATTNSAGTGAQIIPVSQVLLAIANIGVPVTSVQYLQGAIGEYIITFTIPATINSGSTGTSPFPTGVNESISLGVVASNGQTLYDTAPVALPGIH